MFVPTAPRFQPNWFRPADPPTPDWLSDPEWTPPGARELYAHARTGLYASLGCLDVPRDGVALLPAYTALSAIQAFREYGLDVEYYAIEEDLSLSVPDVADRIAAVDPDVFMLHHYFGFADPNYGRLLERARDRGAVVVEDCARALFNRDANGDLLGSRGDVAIFSLRKVLPVPHGGLVVSPAVESFPAPSRRHAERADAAVSLAITAQQALGTSFLSNPGMRELLCRLGYAETDETSIEHDWSGASPGRLSRIGLAHCDPERIAALRRARYAALRESLAPLSGFEILTPPAGERSSPFGVALRVDGGKRVRNHVFSGILDRGLPTEVLQWPMPPGLDPGPEFGAAATLRDSILILPTHQQVPARAIPLVADAVAEQLGSVRPPERRVPAVLH